MTPAVAVRDLRKRYGGRTVLDGISFSIPRGELFALLGPNGAGKTTTVEILEGYRAADGGSVAILGLDPARDGTRLRPRIGLMLQDEGLERRATAREALHLYARLHRRPAGPDVLLDVVGLGAVADTRIRRLSGGERRRLGLALALVGRPELLVLDEPTAGLDPEAKAATRALLAALRDAGMTILLTTHDLDDVERLADRLAILDAGRVVASGRPAEIAAGAVPVLRFRLADAHRLDEDGRRALETRLAEVAGDPAGSAGPGARLVEDGAPGRHRLEGIAPTPDLVAALAAWCAARGMVIAELRAGGGTLEERYLEIVGTGRARDAG